MTERLPKLLLTGASGFVGKELLAKLMDQEKYEIHVLERYVTGRYSNLSRDVQTHFADVRDPSTLRNEIKLLQPDVVVHFAAISPVSYSYDHPNEVIETNFLGTVNLAEICRQNVTNLRHFIYAGTTEEYGVTPYRPANEETLCVPNSPYSVAKHAGTDYLRYMFLAYDFPATIVRCTNSYGRKDDNHFFIEKIISQMVTGRKQILLGDDQTVRDFMYVSDHVDAYLSVLEHREESIGEILNFTSDRPMKLNDVIKLIAKLANYEGEIIHGRIPRRPLDIENHLLDASKSKKLLGWIAKISLEQGLAWTISYWREKLMAGNPARSIPDHKNEMPMVQK